MGWRAGSSSLLLLLGWLGGVGGNGRMGRRLCSFKCLKVGCFWGLEGFGWVRVGAVDWDCGIAAGAPLVGSFRGDRVVRWPVLCVVLGGGRIGACLLRG